MQMYLGFDSQSLMVRVTVLPPVCGEGGHLPQWEIYVLLLGRKGEGRQLFLPQLPSAQNNPYAKVAHLGTAYPLRSQSQHK